MSGLSFDLAWTAPHGGFRLACAAELPARGVTAVYGPSGAGKSTLLHCIAGLRRGDPGTHIAFAGEPWQAGGNCLPAHRRRAAAVFQDARLFPHLSVAGNLAYARRRAAPGGPEPAALSAALGIETLLPRRPDTLSAGQKQRVAIARALLANPRLLLLDEPLANLDGEARRECLAALQAALGELAIPLLYVSHSIEEITGIADELLVLTDGALAARGPLLDLAGRLDSPLADEADAAAIVEVTVAGTEAAYGLTRLTLAGEPLWVTAEAVAPGQRRRLRIPARDVSVCRTRPADTSILNLLPVTLEALRPAGDSHCLLQLTIDGQRLLARITRKSAEALALAPGDALYAQIKSTALAGDSL